MKSPVANYLLTTYGPRLTLDDLAKVLRLSTSRIRHLIAADELGVKTYLDGRRRWADYRDVAAYLDQQRNKEVA
jgi:hypothetical protein